MPTNTIRLATPTNTVSGVIVTPPGAIRTSIKRQVDLALSDIPAGKRGALVAVATQDGVNVAVAHRSPSGRWHVAAWVGKTWRGGAEAGAEVKMVW